MAAIADRRWYFTRDVLLNSPSRKCQIEPEKELSYRQQAANLIQDMGQRLQVNQLCINTAIVYMHRFYVFHSFQKFPRNSIAAAALFLAAKVEEQPHKLEYVIKVHHACLYRGGPSLDTKSDAYLQQAQELVINESILLQTLGFEVAVDHPHTHVVKCTQMIRGRFKNALGSPSKDLAQTSYFMATNSLHLTTFCLQYKPTVVACVCIYLVAKWSQWEIMKSSDGKDWWEYVDPTVTKELLDELTNEFLRIFDACPSRLKRRIFNEKLTSQSRRPRVKEDSHSSSSAKSVPSSSASVSSIDSGLPGSGNSESSVNTQESTGTGHGDSNSSMDGSNTDFDKLGLHEINMGLPMVEGSMFPLDSDYGSGSSYNQSTDPKQGLPGGPLSDSDQGKAGDQQGHPVKKSLKEYREQKERERMKAAQQSRESGHPRPSHTATRLAAQTNQHPSSLKGNVSSPHIDQRHRDGSHGQGSQKHRPEDKHFPLDHRKAEKPPGARSEQLPTHPQAKSSGRPTDLRPTRDQRPHSQHRPHDLASYPAPGANVTEPRHSKNIDQHHKPSRDVVPNSSDRKQYLGSNVPGKDKDHKRNGLENREHGANSRLPETTPRIPNAAASSKQHVPGTQRPHHTETPKAHNYEKVLPVETHGKPNAESLRPTKSELHRSQRPEIHETAKVDKHRTPTPELLKLQKSQSVKPQRSETSRPPPSEKQRTQPAVPPLVPLVDASRKQRSGFPPVVETQKVEPPQPIDHELPKGQRPERILVQQPDALKVNKTITPPVNRHDMSKGQKSEDMLMHRPDVLKIPKTDSGTTNRTESPNVKSPGLSKGKGQEVLKSHKLETSKPRRTEVPKVPRTETQDIQKVETQRPQKSDVIKSKESEVARTQKPCVPHQLKAVKAESKFPEAQVVEKSGTPTTQKVPQSQPQRPETPKKHRPKPESGQLQRPTTPKAPAPQVKSERVPVDKIRSPVSPMVPKAQMAEAIDAQGEVKVKMEMTDGVAPANQSTGKKTLTALLSKAPAPISEKSSILPSQKLAVPKSRQPVTPNSDSLEKAKLQKFETVHTRKTDTQVKPATPKSQRSGTPKSKGSLVEASSQIAKSSKASEPPVAAKASLGGTSDTKVLWESAKLLEIPKQDPHQGADNESVDADIDKLINEHMMEQSKIQGLDQPLFPDLKSTLPQPSITEQPKEHKRERGESSLPKSYREKESHHRKKRSEDHRSKNSPHKHRRLSDHKRAPPAAGDSLPSSADQRAGVPEVTGEGQPHSSILTTSSGIKLKIKGLSTSMNSGTSGGGMRHESSPDPGRQTSSPGLVMKLNLSKVQASQGNSDSHPKPEDAGSESSSHRHHHHHHRKHRKHHHKSRSHHRSKDGSDSHSRKRSHSRSDSVSSGGRDVSPVASSPAKKRAHHREGPPHPKSLLPSDQSLLSLPMPPMVPASSGFMDYDRHSAASTGQFSYNVPDYSNNAPLTTVTALPSSEGFGYYPYNQSSEGHRPPPPPPPRGNQPPPPPPPPM